MKKKKVLLWILLVCLLSLAGSGITVVSILNARESETKETEKVVNLETFSAWTDIEEFQDVPVIKGTDIKICDISDYGKEHYMAEVNGTTVEEYKEYVQVLTDAGFQKHSDNGEDAMEGYAYTASFVKNELTVVVSHAVTWNKTYITAAYDMEPSDQMIYKEESTKRISAEAKTKVHMVEINDNGACFIIELRNGHFVVLDGGYKTDAPYFMDYIEELTPGDEKAVIEAWFISHAHADHYGVFYEISTNQQYLDRLYVNAVYYQEPSMELLSVMSESNASLDVYYCTKSYLMFKAEDGSQTKFYRPQFGQRYYFCDIYIDVCVTPEQFPLDSYYLTTSKVQMNDTSLWLMVHLEEQRMLVGGDSFQTGIRAVTNMFEESYLDVEIFVVLHHGINVYNYFTDYMTLHTVLYPNFRIGSIFIDKSHVNSMIPENEYLVQKAEECISCENGTVILTFPYKQGEAKVLGAREWIYNGGRKMSER